MLFVIYTFILTTGTDLSGSTDTLYTPNGYTLINTNPYYFVLSGFVDGSTLYYFTGYARYWSSTAVSASQAYSLYFNSGGVWPANRSNRYDGRSLRCVADAKMIVNCKNMLLCKHKKSASRKHFSMGYGLG